MKQCQQTNLMLHHTLFCYTLTAKQEGLFILRVSTGTKNLQRMSSASSLGSLLRFSSLTEDRTGQDR